jgi:hypothetical protein
MKLNTQHTAMAECKAASSHPATKTASASACVMRVGDRSSPPIPRSTRIGRAFPRQSCAARRRSRLPKGIGAYVSSLNSCQYCYGGHRVAAELFGIAPETIDGLIHDLATAPVDSHEGEDWAAAGLVGKVKFEARIRELVENLPTWRCWSSRCSLSGGRFANRSF